jgi:hypothetical protein
VLIVNKLIAEKERANKNWGDYGTLFC